MLTNKIFDTFLAVLQQQATRPAVSSLAEGQLWQQDLQRARLEFEDALSSKLLDLSKEKQIEFLTQVLTLFKANSALLLPQPAYLWHIDKWIDAGLKWQREPNEPFAVKIFRDECERHITTNIDNFLDPLEAFSETAKEAGHFVRLVTNHAPGTIDGVPEMELDDEEGRWIEEGLRILEAGKAQENVRQYFEKLAGKEAAAYWILNPDNWYEIYRESMGLPWLQEKFQASYEAWHFYYRGHTKASDQTEAMNEPATRQKVTFRSGFTVENADQLAADVGLIDEQGNYIGMPGVAAGRLYGFYWALRNKKKVNGSLELLRDYFALRYLKKPITSKPNGNSNVAEDMITDTENALKRLSPTANQG